jgi:rhodanese-related sulfurtransferase
MPLVRISPTEAHARMTAGATYLDVRSVPEFEAGHPAQARNIPIAHAGPGGMLRDNPDFVDVVTANFPRDAALVVGCRTGVRSQRAALLLEAAGFANVVEMRGGFAGEHDPLGRVVEAGWVALGLPVASQAAPGASWREMSVAGRP